MDLIVEVSQLAVWAREDIADDDPFAVAVLEQLTEMLHEYGDPRWTSTTIPRRAFRIGIELAKNYYLNPNILQQETTGPISERRADIAIRALEFSEAEKLELAALAAGDEGPVTGGGLSVISTTRGPVEMWAGRDRWDVVDVLQDQGDLTVPPLPIGLFSVDDPIVRRWYNGQPGTT